MHLILLTLLIGIVAGLRAFIAPAAVSWAAHTGLLTLTGTPLAFMGYAATPYVFTALALFEFVTDLLPSTPSRKVPPQFAARIITGSLSGASIGAGLGNLWLGLVCGAIGAGLGTLGGATVRSYLASAFQKDIPAGLTEDIVAVLGAYLITHHIA